MNTKFSYGNIPPNTSISINLESLNHGKRVETDNKTLASVENPHRWYGEDWIVMQNKLVWTISSFSLEERRIILYLSRIVRLALVKDPNQRFFDLDMREFCKSCEIAYNNKYFTSIAKSCYQLKKKGIDYWIEDKNEKDGRAEGNVNFLSDVQKYPRQAKLKVEIPTNMIIMLSIFSEREEERFTKYQWDLIINLGKYGLILLELIYSFVRFKEVKEFTVEFMRAKFEYPSPKPINDFNRYILDKAIKDVNDLTDVEVSYTTENRNGGRAISHYILNAVRKPNTLLLEKRAEPSDGKEVIKKPIKPLTANQIKKLAKRKEEFINVNTHMNSDKTLGYYDIFENFKPLLQSEESVNKFNFISEFLALTPSAELPEAIRQYKPSSLEEKFEPSQNSIKPKNNDEKPSLTPKEAECLVNLPKFCEVFHGGVFGNQYADEIGSEKHKLFLRFRLVSHLHDFFGKPEFNDYYKQAKQLKAKA